MKYRLNKYSLPAVLISAFLFILSCATVPLTERKSLNLVPEPQLVSLSLQEYREILKKSKLSKDPVKVAMVKRVGSQIALAAERFMKEAGLQDQIKDYQWEFNLIENDKVVNAWAMPGGKVAVYTGILPICKDENGLAVVLGHEIAHVLARHGNERMSQALLVNLGGMALSTAIKTKPEKTRRLLLAVFSVGAGIGLILPYSRLHESEADRIGLALMAMAGYDPRRAISFWRRMSQTSGPRPPEFLSTHPAPESRIENIKKYISEAMPYYEKAKAR